MRKSLLQTARVSACDQRVCVQRLQRVKEDKAENEFVLPHERGHPLGPAKSTLSGEVAQLQLLLSLLERGGRH